MNYVPNFLIGAATGAVLSTCEVTFRVWQFWAVMACLAGVYVLGRFQERREEMPKT